jgi:signal transduction histidine kinase
MGTSGSEGLLAQGLTEELAVFHDLARAVAAGPYDVPELLHRVCVGICNSFGFERALFARYDPDLHATHGVVFHNLEWPGDEWLPLQNFPLVETALACDEAVFSGDPVKEGVLPTEIAERFGVRSLVVVPLSVPGTCLGFLLADRAGSDFVLRREELDLLTALGSIAGVFLDKADQYEELRRLEAVQRDFISIASHELRTPIAVVHGIASTLHLRGNELRPEQLDELRLTMFEQAGRLRELADQLLDLSRIDAGAMTMQSEPVRPCEEIETLVSRLAPDRRSDVHVEGDTGLVVDLDRNAFDRVIGNLILNALRYGRPPITVTVGTENSVEIAVEDHGPGVDPQFQSRMFDRFSRSDASRDQASGAGLGLAIARSFADALGATLRYETVRPTGARFVLALPR